jgi:hypothetical protein
VLDGSRCISLALSLAAVFALAFQLAADFNVFRPSGAYYRPNAEKAPELRRGYLLYHRSRPDTAPDALSRCFLALTLIFLYELSIILIGPPKKEDLRAVRMNRRRIFLTGTKSGRPLKTGRIRGQRCSEQDRRALQNRAGPISSCRTGI